MISPSSLYFSDWGLDAYGIQEELKILEGLTLYSYTKEDTKEDPRTVFYFGETPFSKFQYKIIAFDPSCLESFKGSKVKSVVVHKTEYFSIKITMEEGSSVVVTRQWFWGGPKGFLYATEDERLVRLGTFSEKSVLS